MSTCLLQDPNTIGLFFEILGVVVILYGQINFFIAARKEYGSVKKALIHMSGARVGSDVERLKEMSEVEANKLFKKFPLAELIRDDIQISVLGLILTLIGLSIEIAAPIL